MVANLLQPLVAGSFARETKPLIQALGSIGVQVKPQETQTVWIENTEGNLAALGACGIEVRLADLREKVSAAQ
jgi:hypothetical protein